MYFFPAAELEVQPYSILARHVKLGAIKGLTCRHPAGLPLEKGVGNYIAFRLIRHSCQI